MANVIKELFFLLDLISINLKHLLMASGCLVDTLALEFHTRYPITGCSHVLTYVRRAAWVDGRLCKEEHMPPAPQVPARGVGEEIHFSFHGERGRFPGPLGCPLLVSREHSGPRD